MKYLIFLLVLLPGIQVEAHPYGYVKVRPTFHERGYMHPVCTAPGHTWIGGEWAWDSRINNYVMAEGRWVVPPYRSRWIPGHWKQTYRGFFWVPGHWRAW